MHTENPNPTYIMDIYLRSYYPYELVVVPHLNDP